jgi:hypothetical protein
VSHVYRRFSAGGTERLSGDAVIAAGAGRAARTASAPCPARCAGLFSRLAPDYRRRGGRPARRGLAGMEEGGGTGGQGSGAPRAGGSLSAYPAPRLSRRGVACAGEREPALQRVPYPASRDPRLAHGHHRPPARHPRERIRPACLGRRGAGGGGTAHRGDSHPRQRAVRAWRQRRTARPAAGHRAFCRRPHEGGTENRRPPDCRPRGGQRHALSGGAGAHRPA